MSDFFSYEYNGYQVGLLPRDRKMKENQKRRLPKHHRRWSPYFYGENVYFDLWIVPTKQATGVTRFRYWWILSSPDGEKEFNRGEGVIEGLTPKKAYKRELDMGHMSETGQYKLELIAETTINNVAETNTQTHDFDILSRDLHHYHILMTTVDALISLAVGGIAGGIVGALVARLMK